MAFIFQADAPAEQARPTFAAGDAVVAHSLSRSTLNGRRGRVVVCSPRRARPDRTGVVFEGEEGTKLIKPEQLRPLPAKCAGCGATDHAQMTRDFHLQCRRCHGTDLTVDPCSEAGVRPGQAVVAHSLRQESLNGVRGKVLGSRGTDRIQIEFADGIGRRALRPANVAAVRGWCHSCAAPAKSCRFSSDWSLTCATCGGEFVEAVASAEEEAEARDFGAAAPVAPEEPQQETAAARNQQPVHVAFGNGGVPFAFLAPGVALSPFGSFFGPDFDAFQLHLAELASQAEEPRAHPPSAGALAELERATLDEETATAEGVVPCAICQEQYAAGDQVTRMPCGHLFHGDCLSPWLSEHNSCPVCRHELRTTDDEEAESRKRPRSEEA